MIRIWEGSFQQKLTSRLVKTFCCLNNSTKLVTSGSDTIIKAGLAPGDTIIVDGLTKVKNGVKVNAKLLSKEQLKATK